MRIEIDPQIYKFCVQFAADRIGGSEDEYRRRGEARIAKMQEDILTGALGEFAAYNYLKSKGIEVCEPDLEIYKVRDKSFSADLMAPEGKFHVKSQGQESASRYGASWLCQKQDKLLSQPDTDDYFVFAIVEKNVVNLKAVVTVQDIVDKELVSEPKVWKYRHSKVALYLDDILDSEIELWRF